MYMSRLPLILIGMLTVTLSGCTNNGNAPSPSPGAMFDSLKSSLDRAVDKTTAKLSGKGGKLPAPLEGILAEEGSYPRIAFTVVESPSNHADIETTAFAMGSPIPSACWTLSAKVWHSASNSEDVPAFTACNPDILAHNVPLRNYERWWHSQASKSTGNKRTQGPKPPEMAFPKSIKYASYYGPQNGIIPAPAADTQEGLFWASVFYHMGLEPSNWNDHRVWIYKYVSVEN